MSFLFWKVKVRASKKSNICETRESLHNFYFGIKKVELKKVYSTSQKCSADKGLYITIWINSFSALKPRQKFVFLIQKYVKNEIFMALCRDFYHFCPYYRTKEIFQIKKSKILITVNFIYFLIWRIQFYFFRFWYLKIIFEKLWPFVAKSFIFYYIKINCF